MSGLPRFAGCLAGDESRSAADDGADRVDARLRHRADLQVRSEKLFLSGHAKELSDLTIRHATVRKRPGAVARSRLSKRRAEKYRDAGQASASGSHPS